ncbi:MAG: DUF1871 family protein [Aristaeellaceae bacterium]
MRFVEEVINHWDPIGLLSFSPDDEYHSECERIQELLKQTNDIDELASGIYTVFVESFGIDVFEKSTSDCRCIAERLLQQNMLNTNEPSSS